MKNEKMWDEFWNTVSLVALKKTFQSKYSDCILVEENGKVVLKKNPNQVIKKDEK